MDELFSQLHEAVNIAQDWEEAAQRDRQSRQRLDALRRRLSSCYSYWVKRSDAYRVVPPQQRGSCS